MRDVAKKGDLALNIDPEASTFGQIVSVRSDPFVDDVYFGGWVTNRNVLINEIAAPDGRDKGFLGGPLAALTSHLIPIRNPDADVSDTLRAKKSEPA